MGKKILSSILISVLLYGNFSVFAEVDEEFEGSQEQFKRDYSILEGEKVGFLVEGINLDGTIKRPIEGYDIDNFLSNDSVKNINSGFNGDFGNVRLETSSQNNIASYFPSVFDWNVPYKIYKLDSEGNKSNGEKIYSQNEEENLCTYGFTRSISNENDITTKIDIYGLSGDGKKLIGKDIYNSSILAQLEKRSDGESEILNEAITSARNNSILVETSKGHELYNYANYGGSLRQSIMGPALEKYSVNTYLEKIKGEMNLFDSEIRFSDISSNKTSDISEGKEGNYIKIGGADNEEIKHKYFIINNNKFIKGENEVELDVNKLFIQYEDLIKGLSEVDSDIIRNIKSNYRTNISSGIPSMLQEDENNLYERGRMKNTLLLIGAYLKLRGVDIPTKYENLIIGNSNFQDISPNDLSNLSTAYFGLFFSTLNLSFKTIHTDIVGNTSILPLTENFNTSWPIGSLDEKNTKIGFYLYNSSGNDGELSFEDTISYGDIGNSFGIYPFVNLKDKGTVGFSMGFLPDGDLNGTEKALYNSIIGGSAISSQLLNNEEFKYIYGIKEILSESSKKDGNLNIKMLYNSPGIIDFHFKNDITDIEIISKDNLLSYVVLGFNYFNNGEAYKLRDISKEKISTKHPYVFPVSYYIDKNSREYSAYSGILKKLKGGENSYFKACLGDTGLKKLYSATPESTVYTKKVSEDGEDFLITYKSLEFQFKFAGELAMGSDFGFYGDMPPSESINLGNFMNNNPLKGYHYKGVDLKIENFLSGKSINVWSGFQNRNNDRYSYGFRVFRKAGDNLISYKENGASNKTYDPDSGHLFNALNNSLISIKGNTFGDGNGEIVLNTGNKDTSMGKYNFNNELYSSVSCPVGYDLYDDYEKVYKLIYNKELGKDSQKNDINIFSKLEDINYRAINSIEHQAITSYFNTPKPFCVYSSLPKDPESVMRYIERMFTIDDGNNEMEIEERYNYALEQNPNPFIYYDSEKENFKFSTVYLNTLRSLFSSEYQRFPSYNKVSENVDKLYTQQELISVLGYIDYSDKIDEIIDNVILYNVQKEDEAGGLFSVRYKSQKSKIKSFLSSQNKVLFSGVYGLNMFANPSDNPKDFSSSINSEIFPVIGALKVIKTAGIDFYCKDSEGNKTQSLILKGKCYSKASGNIDTTQKLYINNGKDLAISNGAFVNNTILLPFFKRGISIKDTSGTLFLNKNVNNQGKIPFISTIEYNKESGELPLKPRITALRGISSDELIETQLNQGYGYRAGGFLFPYSKFLNSTEKHEFNNLLINSSLDTDYIKVCRNIFFINDRIDSVLGSCPDGYFGTYDTGTYYPFVINNLASSSIGKEGSDYTTLDVPLSFGDVQVNKDMDYYTQKQILNNKAELIAGKSSIIAYVGDGIIRDKKLNLNTGYLDSGKNEKDFGEFLFLQIKNISGGMNNNSIFYEIVSNFIPEICLFGDNPINSCIEEYDIFDSNFTNKAGIEKTLSTEKVCLELNGDERVYTTGNEAENDIDQTGYCNLSCTNTNGEEIVFSSNNYFVFTENQGDLACIVTKPTKLKIFDGYSVNNFLKKKNKSVDLGRYYPEDEGGDNGTGVPLNDDDGTCYYNNAENGESVKCTDGFLSRYSSQRKKDIDDMKDNPGYRNSYHYVDDIELGKNVSTNFNGVYNNDLIVLTSNSGPIQGESINVQGGYIGTNSSIVDPTTGGIKEPYIFSDNDNPLGEGEIVRNTFLQNTGAKNGRQERRDRIKGQLQVSAGNGSTLSPSPNAGLNYLAYKIPKEDFFSLNGIFRVAKDSTQFFTNLKIQNPENESELLSQVDILSTYFSHNNLTIKYGSKFYTWGNNDSSCNGVNPNEVYNKIDLISGDKTVSREDTMTLCLSDNENLSQEHELSNDIYILLPIKPTKAYNKMNTTGVIERNIDMNSAIVVENGYINGRRTDRDDIFNLQTYFQGYFTNSSNSLDVAAKFLDIFDSGSSDYGLKGRYVTINRQSQRKKCKERSDGRRYWYAGYTEYNAKFSANKIIINQAPKIFANAMITKHDTGVDKTIFVLPISISQTTTIYSGSSDRKTLNNGASERYGCDSDRDEKREARNDARANMTRNIELFNTGDITYGSAQSNTALKVFNNGNIIHSFYIPSYDLSKYQNNISYTTVIKDTYIKAGNLLNNLGVVKSNNNFVSASLKENEYKVNVGDYLDFQQDIIVSGDIVPQLMYLKTQLDRGLEMDISTLEIERNGLKQTPIFTQDKETQNIIGEKYNTKYIISKINRSGRNEENVFESNSNNQYNDTFTLSKNEKITVTEGKLFLEVLSDGAKIYGTKGAKYWRGTDSDITLIFERSNGIIKEEDLSDIFTDLGTQLERSDILTIGAGEYVRFADNSIEVKVIPFHSLPEYLLNYSRDKVITNEQVVGIPYLDSGFEDLEINPSRTQPYYVFECSALQNQVNFRRQSTTLNFTNTIGSKYCGVFNKYTDLVFNGYINAMSSYNRLVMPSQEYRFTYGDENEANAKLLATHAKYKGIHIARTSRGYMNGDREKQLIVNLGLVEKGDRITIKYKAKISNNNDLGHVLYNYDDVDSKSVQKIQEDNDTLLGFLHNKNNDIYSKSLKTQLFFLTHFGKQVNIFDKEQSFEGGGSIKGKLEITPNIDISVVNLSGRKGYNGCNPLNETTGRCNQFNSLETLNKNGEDYANNGEVIKKDGESQAILYKGQKFFIRATITNNFRDKNHIYNTLNKIDLDLAYNSDLVLFDGIIIENSFNSDGNILQNSQGKKVEVLSNNISDKHNEIISGRVDVIQDIENSSLTKSYKMISHSVSGTNFNNDGGVTVDYLFTVKNSLNAENIKELFGNAYLKDIGGIFILDTRYEKRNTEESIYQIDYNNTAFQDVTDYEGSVISQLRDNFTNNNVSRTSIISNGQGSKSFQYFKIPFNSDYKYDPDSGIITNLNPNLATFHGRIVNLGGNDSGAYNGSVDDGIVALELLITNTSSQNISLVRNSLKFSLPNGFSVDKIEYTSFSDSNDVELTLITQELYSSNLRGTLNVNDDYGKKTYLVNQENDFIIPGERVQYLVYLNITPNEADLYSSFTSNIDIIREDTLTTLFTDTSINIDTGLGNLSIKSLPIISENDAYFGAGFIKNKVTNQSLLDNNTGNSGYNIIGGAGSKIDYSGDNATTGVLDGSLQPILYDIKKILNESINTYSVIEGSDLTDNASISYVAAGRGYYLIKPDSRGEIKFQNNTLYNFGDSDVLIGDSNIELSDYKLEQRKNTVKSRLSGITLFTRGTISVNNNIYLENENGSVNFSEINYVAFMGQTIEINPRVSHIEGTYASPLTSNSYVTKDVTDTGIDYSSSGNIGIFRPGYSNIPLTINGSVNAGNIIRERQINEGIEGENITEKYDFDYNLYLGIPPIIRK